VKPLRPVDQAEPNADSSGHNCICQREPLGTDAIRDETWAGASHIDSLNRG